ncbi:MAG: MBL fold metallo-hydrolase [Gemmatimonadota bacterium]|nr:MBL fold metallo-hydrolase [Gemmatimonadota bacterium]
MRTLLLLLVSASALAAQDPSAVWSVQEWRPGVHASVVRDGVPWAQYATSLIVVGDDGVLVVDTRDTPRAALDLLAHVRRITDRPVRWVVNTHWHWDHMGGNQVFADSFPDVEIVAHAETARRIREDGAARFAEETQRLEARVERLERWQAQGRTDDGQVLADDDRAQITAVLARDRKRIQDLSAVRIVPPTLEVTEAWSPPGWPELRVLHPGPAHTDGDLVVLVTDQGVGAIGDLIEHGLPWFGDGTVRGTAQALARIDALDPTPLLLPGHGPIPTDHALRRGQRAFLDAVDAALRAPDGSWRSLEEARAALDADAHRGAFPDISDAAWAEWVDSVLEQRRGEG